jgi:hypothetical protein
LRRSPVEAVAHDRQRVRSRAVVDAFEDVRGRLCERGFVSEILFGLSLYSVSWPPEGATLSVEAAVESSVVGAAGDAAAARNGGHDDDDGTKQGESVRPHVA